MMKLFILLFLSGAALAWKTYDGYQVLEVVPEDKHQLTSLRNLMLTRDELDFWREPSAVGRSVQVMVEPELVGELKWTLELWGLKINVMYENVRDIVGDHPRINDKPENRDYDYGEYNTYEDYMTELDNLNTICNGLTGVSCEVSVIGESVEGRDIRMLTINTGAANNFWIDSCIHAREWLACATTMGIVNRMLTDDSQEASNLLMSHNWYFVPVFNPDGYEYTWTNDRFWRKSRNINDGSSCIGTDLNRNHAFEWDTGGSSSSPCSDTYHGSSAASEPEVQAVEAAGDAVPNLRGWLSFHTNGEWWLIPYGDCTDDPEFGVDAQTVADATCDAISETYNTFWECGNSCRVLYATSGTTADWAMGHKRVKYSYTPELRGPGFDPPISAIPLSIQEIWNGLVAKIDTIEGIEGAKK